jgi:hypothetical protein
MSVLQHCYYLVILVRVSDMIQDQSSTRYVTKEIHLKGVTFHISNPTVDSNKLRISRPTVPDHQPRLVKSNFKTLLRSSSISCMLGAALCLGVAFTGPVPGKITGAAGCGYDG